MGSYTKIAIGAEIHKNFFFKRDEEKIFLHDKWDQDGEMPRYHPDTGEELIKTEEFRVLRPPFDQFKEEADKFFPAGWRGKDRPLSIDALREFSEAMGFALVHACTLTSTDRLVLGGIVCDTTGMEHGGPKAFPIDTDELQDHVRSVQKKFDEIGLNKEAELYVMVGWVD